MTSPVTQDSLGRISSRLRKIELPWLILGALLLSTLFAAFQSSRQLRADADTRFAEIAQSEKRALIRQLNDVETLLRSANAFVAVLPATASSAASQGAWDTFVTISIRDGHTYPGLVALQLIRGVDAPAGTATMTSLLAPPTPGNKVSAWSASPALADAISRATSTAAIVMSEPLGATTGAPPPANFVALALPFDTAVSKNRAPAISPTKGSAIAIVDLGAMMASIMTRNAAYPVVHELYDGERRLFPSPGTASAVRSDAEMNVEIPAEFGQRILRLKISSTPLLEKSLKSDLPRAILVIGIFGTMLLGALVLLLTRLRQQAEALAASMTRKLQDQTRFTEDLIEFNPNPIFRKDTAGRFVAVNQAWEQLGGRKREDILGKTDQDLQPHDTAVQNDTHDMQFLASQSDYEASEAFITNTDGRQFETIVAKKILKRADGAIDGMIGTITDVTLIKKLERELARQREQLDLVIRSSQQGIWDIELVDGGTVYFSDRFREILGYVEGNFPAKFAWMDHVHPEDTAEVRRCVIAHFKGLTPLFDIESRIKRNDGRYMWIRVRAIAQRNAESRAIRFVGSISDVTDRKLAEVELMEANVRVTEAARAKEAFLATMSHEIRTPLNGVLGMTSLLSETSLNDEQQDYIHLIRSSGDTLLRLIDDVLDFSKIESGQMTLESVVVEIVTVVEEAFELVAEKAREKGLALLFDMHDDVPFYILGDPTRLRQILLNLLSNAIKFTAAGEITLTLRARQLTSGQLELEGRVLDTGIGIPADRASKLFQPFTQVDASTTRKYGGTGLGLAIVRRLSQLMGGNVTVESTEGVGSTFIFTVLTSAASGPTKPYMQRDVAIFVAKRLLVVDRNANRRKIQQHRYARWGFDTVTSSPEEAVQIFTSERPFDILLTEMVAPSPQTAAMRDALEKDDRERQGRGEAPMPVILQSAISRAELSKQQMTPTLRHDAFIMRPAGRAKIFDVFTRAVAHEQNLDFATRPYSLAPGYDAEYLATSSNKTAASRATRRPVSTNKNVRGNLFSAKIADRPVHILVAEDNEINQQVILGMLKNIGCETELARDGSDAVEKAIAGSYDLILMDIHMPVLDGVTAMNNIRRTLASRTCPPIVAMTAHALPGDRERYLAMGMDDYVSKPIRTGDLKSLFERVLPADTVDQPTYAEPPVPPPVSPGRIGAMPPVEEMPILDTEQLEDLRYLPAASGSGNDTQDAVGGLIRLFQTQAIERMNAMDQLLASGHWKQLADIAHSLRGSSASMGFPRVAARCKDLELAARRKQPEADILPNTEENLAELLARIKFQYQEADAALGKWLAVKTAPHKSS